MFLYYLVQEISRSKDVNFNCKISFFSDTPVRSEWSELQSQEESEKKSEVSPFGIKTARVQYFCCFVYFNFFFSMCFFKFLLSF